MLRQFRHEAPAGSDMSGRCSNRACKRTAPATMASASCKVAPSAIRSRAWRSIGPLLLCDLGPCACQAVAIGYIEAWCVGGEVAL